ncbi:MAG: hypothetical protein J6V23_04355 [Bacteroidaceae bacterium]|nr:hypothetical protein [Bacteroidaceae bacterium]
MKNKILLTVICAFLVINSFSQRRTPFTMAYCLDGRTQDIETLEIHKQNPTIGYITFYDEKLVVDNKEVYNLVRQEGGTKAFQGPVLSAMGAHAYAVIFIDENYHNLNNVVMFITIHETGTTVKTPIYLMEVEDFQTLLNSQNGISNNLFINHSIDFTGSYREDSSIGSKSYYNNRYNNKDCHICKGSGICQTCNGDGIQHNSFGLNDSKCANCLIRNGVHTGKCSICGGTGKIYNKK